MSLKIKISNVNAQSWRPNKALPILLDGSPLILRCCDLHLTSYIAALCKENGLYLINCHQRNLPVAILKLLTWSFLLSRLCSAMSCVPHLNYLLSYDLQFRLEKMFNCTIQSCLWSEKI